ncbi:DUF4132 domain-containing protein [Brachyspira hyodysenteriae]|uniref:DUF4132 domain-containing protein n=1 Tax=Brachyspira hyodysenteriae ATCC 27164 TaxID=1266923 RepID=A0A3B6VUB9_BRAHO|nr:DUF4132 domain-containing protein [Brachyspira hyodysenteriae]ANN64568.1 hypothetical protein BHYOB78_12060 [Brachyspira hyodysenteriae ATCC 27164]KLI15505.1 hypothetical protein SU45_10030 [Brachyspira hyodysenteriae]KLI22822.1 hypothetical protein SZ47_12645 [Brachyspira hyodysenteriae]KLI32770.1 hypothetical protein SZ50_08215 [Brachyspira hyodysenteriae]KLI34970.1 hypothetical protein SZ48_03455 [Brachyspira hyodysenteriae]
MEKFNSSLFSKRYEGYNLEKEICVINRGIVENDIYALDFLREANYTYNKDKEYFYSLYKILETSNNCGIYLILTAILLKNEDEKANLKIADKKIDLLMQKIYDSYYVKYNVVEHLGTPNSITVINDDIIYEDDKRYDLIKKFHVKKSAFGYFSALKPYTPYHIKRAPSNNDIEFIKKSILNNYRIYYILLLSDYSKKSKKLLNIILKTNSYKALTYLMLIRKEGFATTYQESLDYLTNLNVTLADIIISYIFFYSYNDRISYYDSFAVQIKNREFNSFFYSLIKKNSEYFESLFTNKNFVKRVTKNSKNFIPFLNELYSKEIDFGSSKILCSLLENKSASIRKSAIKIINRKKKESYEYLKSLDNDLARDILKRWKNKKIINSGFKDVDSIVNFVNKNYNKKFEKNLLCLDESLLYGVKSKNSNQTIPIIIIKYIYLEYSRLKAPTKIKDLDKIISYFDFNSFINVIKTIYDRWIFEGADTTYKYVMIPYLVYESDYKIEKVGYNLKEWCESGRISLANYAISTLAFNGSLYSLILIDYISNNFKYYQIKNTSKLAFKAAAKKLDISEDKLSDKIILDFGIDKEGKKLLKDDSCSFTLYINEKLDIDKIFDNKKKEYITKIDKSNNISKNLLDEFFSIKNNIKATYKFQASRLNKALMTGKKWSSDDWKKIFEENYIMSTLADIFIWTIYNKNDKILRQVKYDRKANTFYAIDNNEEIKLNKQYQLSLASPVEMTDEEIKKAKQILTDLKIKQPFNQMQNINFSFEDGDIKENIIVKYRNKEVKIKTFKNLSDSLDMELDYENSYIVGYKIIDSSISIGIKINLMGMDNAIDDNDIILFGDIVFYTIDNNNEIFSYKNIIDPRTSYVRYVKYIMFNIDNYIKKNVQKTTRTEKRNRRESDIK